MSAQLADVFPLAFPQPDSRGLVMHVDDDDAMRRSTAMLLRSEGFDSLEATCGEHALAQCSPVELTLRGQHGGAEQHADGVEPGLPDGHDLARDHVRIDDWRTELCEGAGDCRLTARDTAREADRKL